MISSRAGLLVPMAAIVAALVPRTSAGPGDGLVGFASPSAARERAIEAAFAAIPSPERTRDWHRTFTAEPHPAGSERNHELALFVAEEWRKQGLEDVVIHRYDVLNTAPLEVSLTMVAPVRYEASLREEPVDAFPDTRNPRVSPGYLGLSASADVEAPVVYAHSGNPEDYEVLRKNGIDVRGKIVLVRYSNPYSWPSLPGARQVKPEEARSLPRIAGLPLSWKDAKPLLENLDGPAAPREWQGGLPLEYRLGGERVRVHLKVRMDNRVAPNYVVEGRIRGSERPDDWVVLGNHRDAWVFGGVDPSSGTASLMEVTRAFGELLKSGRRPRRTLVFCSWDGEEVGLTGSTEWGEQFADDLGAKAVAYLNVDSSASGPDFQPDAVGSLAPLVLDLARELQDPATRRPLAEALRASVAKARAEAGDTAPPADEDLVDVRIGSGSDHTVFLNHLGVPTIGLTFDGPYGVYHSMYDGFAWMNRVGDPGYRYHVLLSRIWGTLALRLANADLLPFDFAAYARHLRRFVADLERASEKGRLDLARLRAGVDAFETAGRRLSQAQALALATGAPAPDIAQRVDRGVLQVERNWLDPDGLPGRPWFKHTLYAARYTYAHLELPGLTEAAEEKDWERAARQAAILERAVTRNAGLLDSLARDLSAGSSRSDR